MERCRECEEDAFRYYSSAGICPTENEIEEYLLYFECNHPQDMRIMDGQIRRARPAPMREGTL